MNQKPFPAVPSCLVRPAVAAGLVAAALLLPVSPARADERAMLLAVDLTREGRQVAPPTPEHPAYYVPVFLGYHERGLQAQHFQRKPADEGQIQRQLVGMLAKQGYLLASHEHPPTLTIAFEWGTISPVYDPTRRVINAAEIRTCVLGATLWDVSTAHGAFTQEMLSLSARHYLLITAFAYQRQAVREDVMLWRAHATTDAWGNYLDEVIEPLIMTARPGLGRETKPDMHWHERPGRVIIGEPVVTNPPTGPAQPK